MSEFELTESFVNHVGLFITFFMAYLSASSAYLAVVYIAGRSIPRFLNLTLTAIYSAASIFLTFSTAQIGTLVRAIQLQLRESVAWHPAATEPIWIIPTVAWTLVAIMAAVYVASIGYMVHVRGEQNDSSTA